jgi:hypothetical protein
MRNFLLILCVIMVWPATGAELHLDFGGVSGAVSTNFSAVLLGSGKPADWKIVMDKVPSAFSPLTDKAPNVTAQPVLAQTSQEPIEERFPMLIYNDEIFRNFTFRTRFKTVSGVAEQMAGVAFRFQNSSNFYVARVSGLGKNFRFYKVVNGIRSNPIGPTIDFAPDAWHSLTVKCDGNQITLSLDDKLAMPPLSDNTFTEGKIGFWTMADSVSYFTDATVNYTPRVAAAQAMVNSVLDKQTRLLGLQIYVLDGTNATRIIASNDPSENGQPGTDAELKAIQNGVVFFGREKGAVLVTLPFPDRNGDDMAAVRVKLTTFFGETQDNAVVRATTILKKMEALCTSADDLRK